MKNIKLMNGKLLSGIAAVLMLAALVVGCKQTVDTPVAVTGVTLNKTALTLEEGTTEKLTAKVNPENAANKKLTWSSDNKEVAEVNQDGTVRAKKVGIAKITVTTEDGSKTADCTVTVTPPKYQITFSVEGGHGTLTAKIKNADGSETEIHSGDKVEYGKTVTFTATPDAQFAVEAWTISGGMFKTGGTAGSPTATVDVSAAVTVKVKFKYVGNTLELESQAFTKGKTESFTYKLVKAGSGNYTAEPEDPAVISVALNDATGEAAVQCVGVGSTRITVKDNLSGKEAASGIITVPEGAFLTLSPDKKDIKVKAKTKDGNPIKVTGCTVTTLANDSETTLNATDTAVILEGNIIELELYENKLTALNVQGCAALQRLICGDNQLVSLNLQGLTALQRLDCDKNKLTELDLKGCSALQMLRCEDNELNRLNVEGCTALHRVECNGNKLTALNVQGCTALQSLSCNGNELTELNLQGLTALGNLECHRNQLSSLNVQDLTVLSNLGCSRNQLTALNVQGCTVLEELHCYGNKLNDKAMTKLLNDLPEYSPFDRARCILYTEQTGVTEGNHKDFTAPPELKAAFDNAKDNKHWNMYKINEHGHEDELE